MSGFLSSGPPPFLPWARGGLCARIGLRSIELSRNRVEFRRGPGPAQRIDTVEERQVRPQRRERSKEQRAIPIATEGGGQSADVGDVHMPVKIVCWDLLEVVVFPKNTGRRFRSPPRKARITVGRVACERQLVGDRFWQNAELLNHTLFITNGPGSPIQLDDASS